LNQSTSNLFIVPVLWWEYGPQKGCDNKETMKTKSSFKVISHQSTSYCTNWPETLCGRYYQYKGFVSAIWRMNSLVSLMQILKYDVLFLKLQNCSIMYMTHSSGHILSLGRVLCTFLPHKCLIDVHVYLINFTCVVMTLLCMDVHFVHYRCIWILFQLFCTSITLCPCAWVLFMNHNWNPLHKNAARVATNVLLIS